MRGWAVSQATVTWPSGASTTKAAVSIRGTSLVVVDERGVRTEQTVTSWKTQGSRTAIVQTPEGEVRVRRAGGCGCR